jgi:transcription-repair coupling factor (superfamily II helicase)
MNLSKSLGIDFSKLKIIAKSFLITRIEKVKERLIIAFHNNAPINIEKVMQKVTRYPNEFKLTSSSALSLSWKDEYNNTERLVYILSEICNGFI